MASGRDGSVAVQLCTLFRMGKAGDMSDRQLLELFTSGNREEAEIAFAAIVQRHGPLVLRICRDVV